MYRNLDKLLAVAKKKLRTEFNRLGSMGFDELNVVNTRKVTQAMFDRFLADNEALYLDAAKKAYSRAKKSAEIAGYSGEEETEIDGSWIEALLLGYNLVTGYLYGREADRKRMRLNEQILTAREYDSRDMFNDSLRRTANLWWTQTVQYGISAVDESTVQAYKDMGVEKVEWIAADDEKTCSICGGRDGKIYDILKVPPKPHYGCRCRLAVVEVEE
jgi:SPP1 gp7 family putative phage head morphogenesis protein